MKYLIIGLGNPGLEYNNTRHNIGFKVLDYFMDSFDQDFLTDRYAEISKVKIKGKSLILIKPNTFMNLSGKAVRFWMKKEKISEENILVIVDDIALPFQSIRMRKKGSDGGHNGLKDIIRILGTNKFARIKFGVGSNFFQGNQSNYVLGEWTDDEKKDLNTKIDFAIKMIESFVTSGVDRTMNDFNRK